MNYSWIFPLSVIVFMTILILYLIIRSNKNNYTDKKEPLYLFWHIGALKGRLKRLEEIINRQWNLINSSDLYNNLDRIFVGIIGSERPNILRVIMENPKVTVIEPNNTMPSIHECYTTYYLWKFCQNNPNSNVIYIHSRGITHNKDESLYVDDWTNMMEYFIIETWRNNIDMIDNYKTFGCELWDFRENNSNKKKDQHNGKHYSGNFWWAKSTYINSLPNPYIFAKNGNDRFGCGEFWILKSPNFDIKEHKILFQTESNPTFDRPKHDIYDDPIPPHMYRNLDSVIPLYMENVQNTFIE